MKSRYLLELDLAASIESNLKFLDNCEADIKAKRKRLKKLKRNNKNPKQIDIEDAINEATKC